jgi:hypothetical protein
MTEQDLIKFKELSMQDGRLNLQWFAEYVAQAEREEWANEFAGLGEWNAVHILENREAIRARGES